MGLRESIAKASTTDEVHTLLEQGKAFESASRKTKSSWQNTAERRRRQLEKAVEVAAPEKVAEEKPKKSKKSKKNA